VQSIGADVIHMQFRWRGETIKTDRWMASHIVDARPEMSSTLLLRAHAVID